MAERARVPVCVVLLGYYRSTKEWREHPGAVICLSTSNHRFTSTLTHLLYIKQKVKDGLLESLHVAHFVYVDLSLCAHVSELFSTVSSATSLGELWPRLFLWGMSRKVSDLLSRFDFRTRTRQNSSVQTLLVVSALLIYVSEVRITLERRLHSVPDTFRATLQTKLLLWKTSTECQFQKGWRTTSLTSSDDYLVAVSRLLSLPQPHKLFLFSCGSITVWSSVSSHK